jgi:hypothetical protein
LGDLMADQRRDLTEVGRVQLARHGQHEQLQFSQPLGRRRVDALPINFQAERCSVFAHFAPCPAIAASVQTNRGRSLDLPLFYYARLSVSAALDWRPSSKRIGSAGRTEHAGCVAAGLPDPPANPLARVIVVLIGHMQPDAAARRRAQRELEHQLHRLASQQWVAVGHPADAAGHREGLPTRRPGRRRRGRFGWRGSNRRRLSRLRQIGQ